MMSDSNVISIQSNQKLTEKVKQITNQKDQSRNEKLQQISRLLVNSVEVFDWVGFYLVDPSAEGELVLGPYVGEETEHTPIPFGTGICGQAADSHETFVVQDVSEADNYLACSMDVRSEVVIPIMKDETFVAELDIDSHQKNAITNKHQEMLEEICNIVAVAF